MKSCSDPLVAAVSVAMRGFAASDCGVLAAFSGGPDSTALLSALSELSGDLNLRLHATYIDHGLRGMNEIERERQFCADTAAMLGAGFSAVSIDVRGSAKGENIHATARKLRYNALFGEADRLGIEFVATAHNADDQAETVLMRLVRGAGLHGLSGIPARRGRHGRYGQFGQQIIRPLLAVSRAEIEAYLERRSLGYVIDSSNLKTDYFRNRLRLEIMPMLESCNPSLKRGLVRTAALLADENRYIESMADAAITANPPVVTGNSVAWQSGAFDAEDRAIRRRLLRRFASMLAGDGYGIEFRQAEDALDAMEAGTAAELPWGLRVKRENANYRIFRPEPVRGIPETALDLPGVAMLPDGGRIEAFICEAPEGGHGCKTEIFVPLSLLHQPLVVRSRRDGDRFQPAGMGGRSKKLQDFLVDLKIPAPERDHVPIVTCGEQIIWVAGLRMDERFTVKAVNGADQPLVRINYYHDGE